MNWKAIIIAVVVLILVYLIAGWLFKSGTKLSSLKSGKISTTLSPSTLPNNQTNNYTYSIWCYIDDWSYRYGEPKIVIGRLDDKKQPSPSIVLGASENNFKISLACYPSTPTQPPPPSPLLPIIHTCDVANIPLQRWVNVLISLYGRSLDVYIDGKLVRTCVLPGIAKINNNAPVYITPEGGFAGFTSNAQYWPNATNPQQAWDIYKKGYGGSVLGELFNKYRIKISFLQDNTEKQSLEI